MYITISNLHRAHTLLWFMNSKISDSQHTNNVNDYIFIVCIHKYFSCKNNDPNIQNFCKNLLLLINSEKTSRIPMSTRHASQSTTPL